MITYLVWSESYGDILREEKVPILINFATLKYEVDVSHPKLGYKTAGIVIPEGFEKIIIDSGGYQLQSGADCNRLPDVHQYGMWLRDYVVGKRPEVKGYFNLDIFKDSVATMENQMILEDEYGLKPIPIYHMGDDYDIMDYYYDNYEYIAIGGIAFGMAKNKFIMPKIMSMLHQFYPGRKYHLFGVGLTSTYVFKEFSPYSVDFSTWSNPARFGMEMIIENGVIRERFLSDEDRQRLRNDKTFLRENLRRSAVTLKELGRLVTEIHEDEYQGLMFK